LGVWIELSFDDAFVIKVACHLDSTLNTRNTNNMIIT